MIENSLIVLNYNDYATTEKLVKSVEGYKIIDKIIIVDNKSSDESKENLKKLVNDKIDFIETDENKGYSYGNNYGIKYAIKKYNSKNIIISNPDIYIEEKVLRELVKSLEENKEVAIATATMKNLVKGSYETSDLRAWKKPSYSYCLLTALFLCSKFSKKLIAYDNEEFKKKYSEVFAVQGSFFVAKAKVLEEVGLLDEGTFLYCEEMILGSKVKDAGYKEIIFNDLYYNHDHGVTINKSISSVNKYKILNESLTLYLREYLRVSKGKLLLFKLCAAIGIAERKVIYFLLK